VNLAFNFHDKLFWIHNFLPPNLYKEMYISVIKTRKKLGYNHTGVTWRTFKEEQENMSMSYGQDSDTKIKSYLSTYETMLRHQQHVNLINKSFYSHLRRYDYGQHLGWHSDKVQEKFKNRDYAATFYFNKTWQESWGGELLFKSDLGSGFIPIVGNSVIIVKTGLRHKVCANLKKTHPRFSIQTWIDSS